MKIKRSKKHNKVREISPRQARKGAWQAEQREAGLAVTPPAVKVADSFPALIKPKLCRLCADQADCEIANGTITDCPDFIRRRAAKTVELVPLEPVAVYDHRNRKAYALASYRNQLLAQWEFHRAEMRRLEAAMASVEKDIHREAIVKTKCPSYQPPSKLFRDSLPNKPDSATKTTTAKTTKTNWADLELD